MIFTYIFFNYLTYHFALPFDYFVIKIKENIFRMFENG